MLKTALGAYHEQENEAYDELRSTGAGLSITPDPFPPVWSSKPDTDTSYNTCARLLLDTIAHDVAVSRSLSDKSWLPLVLGRRRRVKAPTIGVLFGSHNWDSIRDILTGLEASGLAKPIGRFPPFARPDGHVFPEDTIIELPNDVAERITIGQLYGMGNAISNYIVARTKSSTPVVLKYIPYGSLTEVRTYQRGWKLIRVLTAENRSCHILHVVLSRIKPYWAMDRLRWSGSRLGGRFGRGWGFLRKLLPPPVVTYKMQST